MSERDLDGPTEKAVTRYLDEVARHLAGPRRTRAAIIDELRDGITTAVVTRCARGEEPEPAVRASLREFGPPDTVAAAFADELAVARARRTVASYLATGPLVGLLWLLVLTTPIRAEGLAAVWRTVPAAPAVGAAAVMSVLVLIFTGPAGRHLTFPGRHSIFGALVVVAAAVAGDLVMLTHTASLAGFPISTLGGLAVVASATRLGCSVIASVLCLRSHPAVHWRTAG